MQPSIVEETVTIGGSLSVNVDICTYNEAELAAFVAATIATIKDFACTDSNPQDANSEEEDCTAEILYACGNRQRKLASSRELQASPWQIEYQVTETFTCEVAGCTSPADIAAVASIAETVSTTMGNSMESGSFLTLLSTNIVQTSGLDANIVNCLAVWGVTEEPVTEVGSPGTGRFYPDWDYHSGTCLEDGNEPIYMTNDTAFILDSLEECCERYYSWDTNSCMNVKGSGLWYADVLNNVCVTDCESGEGSTCGGRANVFSDKLYANPRSCCESELAWRFVEFCEVSYFSDTVSSSFLNQYLPSFIITSHQAESLKSECYGGTGLYYRGDSAGVDVCVKDCDPASKLIVSFHFQVMLYMLTNHSLLVSCRWRQSMWRPRRRNLGCTS